MSEHRRPQYLYAHKGWLEFELPFPTRKLATATWVKNEGEAWGQWAVLVDDAEFDKFAKIFGAHPSSQWKTITTKTY